MHRRGISHVGCSSCTSVSICCSLRSTGSSSSPLSSSSTSTTTVIGRDGKPRKAVVHSYTTPSYFDRIKELAVSMVNPRGNPAYYSYHGGYSDPLAVALKGGRADWEWVKLRMLCGFCTTSTVGTWMYGVYFPEKMKQYKDEPWSPF